MDYLVHHMLRTTAGRLPEKEALVCGDERLTYRGIARRVAGVAQGLRQAGLRRGERVGIYLDASVAQVAAIFAVPRAGGVFVPVSGQLFPSQVAHILRDCQVAALITTPARLASLAEVVHDSPSVRFLVAAGEGETAGARVPVHRLESLAALAPPDTWPETCIGRDLAAILYTSGSTGKPKGVMLSHANIIAGASIVSDYLAIRETDRILAALPFSFDAGLNQLMTAFQQGGTCVLTTFLFARELVDILRREGITGLAGVPTLWSLLVQPASTLDRQPLPHLRYVTNTGGHMPGRVLEALRRALPTTQVFLMYGLTEAFRSTYLPPEELDRRPSSMGKAIPDTEILVINERGEPCKPGEVGELLHRGPTVSLGYWGRPEDTARVLRPHPLLPRELGDCERVCHSGDLVQTDEDGYLYYVGRRDSLIKSSGFRISPTEVEEALYASGRLRGAAVIGVPDELLGQAIKAFVVPADGQPVDRRALLEHCGRRLPRYMVPRDIEVLDELPRTSSGKVDYPALRGREVSA
jgi:acyl-CoA ligase (AMP-forming) (exosortase A-associated)